jgi:hypothetical protein
LVLAIASREFVECFFPLGMTFGGAMTAAFFRATPWTGERGITRENVSDKASARWHPISVFPEPVGASTKAMP